MAVQHSKPGSRLHQTKTRNPATTDLPADHEAPWQQLMLFTYLLSEVRDALEQERATCRRTPLNQSWQQFVDHLRLQRPKLGACLDKLRREGFLAEQEGVQ